MLTADFVELAAVRASFGFLVARWRLTQGELGSLLSVPDAPSAGRVLPDGLDASAETRMRLLLRLDRAIAAMCDDADVGALLREPERHGAPRPLDDLADLGLLRAAVGVAEGCGTDRTHLGAAAR